MKPLSHLQVLGLMGIAPNSPDTGERRAAFKKLVTEIRDFELAAGDGVKRVYPSEEPIKAKLRRVRA